MGEAHSASIFWMLGGGHCTDCCDAFTFPEKQISCCKEGVAKCVRSTTPKAACTPFDVFRIHVSYTAACTALLSDMGSGMIRLV
jgi:hypothetical protein